MGGFGSIPKELFESACIDGCGIFKVFFRIALPLAKTGLVVTALMTFVNEWNELLLAMVFISDAYPEDALENLISEVEKIENQDDYISVMGLSADENGKIVGDKYPNNGFDGSIFEMRYKYKVRGDKFGIFITKTYQREISGKDFSQYEGKGYIPQSVIFNEYDARGIKTRFVNKIVRFYLKDDDDQASVSNTRWSGKNLFGLTEGHLSFLNAYGNQLLSYPQALLRNLIGYQTYALKSERKISTIFTEIKNPWIKFLGILFIPLSYIYAKIY
jgi:hypothetical protein